MHSEEKSNLVLTPEQRQAVEHVHGPMVVVAGAGCGKTRVLTERIVHLLRQGVCRPEEILAVTYTVNAAAEIRARVGKQLPDIDVSALKANTFHQYCFELLKRKNKGFKVVDDIDLKVYLRKHIEELPLKIFTRAASPGQFIDDLIKFNSRCQDELITANDFTKFVKELRKYPLLLPPRVAKPKELEQFSREDLLSRCDEIAAVYGYVTALLTKKRWGTFGDMLQGAVKLLRKDPAALAEERARCRFILVDEFQDSNYAQIELASLLGGDEANIFVVGDPDQAIYRFRGATAAAFEEFRRRYPQAKTVTLAHNFRSTPAVLACAHQLIDKNPATSLGRKPLVASSDLRRLDTPVEVMVAAVAAEASAVADSIQRLQKETGTAWSDFAVLYKNNDHREALLEEMHARHIPVEVAGANLTDTAELRDLLSAARAIIRPDDSVALMRAAALPCFAIDPGELKQAMSGAKRNTPVVHTLKSVRGGDEVLRTLASAKQEIEGRDAAQALRVVHRQFDLPPSHPVKELQRFTEEWLQKAICEDPSLGGFLEYLDLFEEAGGKIEAKEKSDRDAVQLMTVHTAKGLEFRHVFVLKTHVFGSNRRDELFEFPIALSKTRLEELSAETLFAEEQRRLFYVAMTRAQQSLTLSVRATAKGEIYGGGYCKELVAEKALKEKIAQRKVQATVSRIEASAMPLLPIEEWVALPASRWSDRIQLSASAIDNYKLCPLKFKLERDWNVPGETTANLQYGAAVHLALKAYYDATLAGRKLSREQLLASFEDSMDTVPIEDLHQAKLYRSQGRVHLTTFYDSRNGHEPDVLATEHWFEITVKDVLIRGRMDRIDRVDGGVHICDYKTGHPKDEKAAEKSLQLGVYALAAKSAGMKAVALSFHNLEDNSTVTTARTEADLAEVESEIETVAQQIRRGAFEANKGYHCRNCQYRTICPAHEQKLYTIAKAVATVQ